MFYFAYLPLFIILLIKNMEINLLLIIIVICLIALGIISIFLLIKTIKSIAPKTVKIRFISNKNAETLSFIVTYVIPFGITFTTLNSRIAFGILFAIIFYLYLDTSLFCINPLLKIIFNYNIYLINIRKREYYLLSKKDHLNGNATINMVFLTKNLAMEDENEN